MLIYCDSCMCVYIYTQCLYIYIYSMYIYIHGIYIDCFKWIYLVSCFQFFWKEDLNISGMKKMN